MGKYEYKFNPISGEFDLVADQAMFHVKDPVDSYSDLPTSGNNENDMRFVRDTDEAYVWTIAASSGDLSDWKQIGNGGDMLKSVYDTDADGIVDKAENVDDGAGNVSTAADIKDAVDKKHNKLHEINNTSNHLGISGSGIEDNFMALDVNGLPKDSGKSASDFANASHNHLEADITDLNHYDSADFATDFGGANLANLGTKSYNDLTDKPDLSDLHAHANKALLDTYDQTNTDISDAVSKKHDEAHTHLEIDITDLDHDAQKIKGKTVDDSAIADGKVLTYNLTSGNIEYQSPAGTGDMLKSVYDIGDNGIVDNSEKLEGSTKAQVQDHTPKAHNHVELDITDLDKYTQAQVDSLLSGKANTSHNHLEADITDLDHDALKIKGITVDDSGIGAGKYLKYDGANLVYDTPAGGGGDMLKSVYDIGDNGIVDKAEALNDGSSGGGNNVTAQQARNHIDDVTTNPHNVTPAQIGETEWVQSVILNTPATVTRLFGQSAEGFHPDVNIRLLRLHVQYYAEHAALNSLRVRVYRYDANATTDRLILSITQSAVSVGYHNIEDITPDLTYYDLDSSAGDTFWIEVDDGSGSGAKRVREITISLKSKRI